MELVVAEGCLLREAVEAEVPGSKNCVGALPEQMSGHSGLGHFGSSSSSDDPGRRSSYQRRM